MRLVVRKNARHVFPLDIGLTSLPRFHGSGVGFPGFSAIGRTSHEDPVSPGSMSPIGNAAQLVEMQRTEIGTTAIVERQRNIPATTPACHLRELSDSERLGTVSRISHSRRLERRHDLIRIVWIHCN